jgi:uncharacterized protein
MSSFGLVEPLVTEGPGGQSMAMLHRPLVPPETGVVIIVGGPQYRVGSHRQFLLLARDLAAAGHAVLRFDHQGVGDSGGENPGFENIQGDVRAAVDRLRSRCPTVQRVYLWGLCDGAAAALLYAPTDSRITGVALLNPWVRSDQTLAEAYIRDYYAVRLFQWGFWKKLFRGEVQIADSVLSLVRTIRDAASKAGSGGRESAAEPLPARMLGALRRYSGRVLLILSENDLTAGEFRALAATADWQEVLARPQLERQDLAEADHTFSRRKWRDEVSALTQAWLRQSAP